METPLRNKFWCSNYNSYDWSAVSVTKPKEKEAFSAVVTFPDIPTTLSAFIIFVSEWHEPKPLHSLPLSRNSLPDPYAVCTQVDVSTTFLNLWNYFKKLKHT